MHRLFPYLLRIGYLVVPGARGFVPKVIPQFDLIGNRILRKPFLQ